MSDERSLDDTDLAALRAAVGIELAVTTRPFVEYATLDTMRNFARAYGDDNPLFGDEDYGRAGPWGTIVAPPLFPIATGTPVVVADEPAAAVRHALRGVAVEVAADRWTLHRWVRPGTRLIRADVIAAVDCADTGTGLTATVTTRSTYFTGDGVYAEHDRVRVHGGRSIADPAALHEQGAVREQGMDYEQAEQLEQTEQCDQVEQVEQLEQAERAERAEQSERAEQAEQFEARDARVVREVREGKARYDDRALEEIDRLGAAWRRQGYAPLLARDLVAGDQIGPMVKGPLTTTDLVAYRGGVGPGPFGVEPLDLARRNRLQRPDFYDRDDTGAWDARERLHWDEAYAQRCGHPSAYDYTHTRLNWMAHLLTDWMGDHARIETISFVHLAHNYVGDTHWIDATIRSVDSVRGNARVELELRGINQRGVVTCRGDATVVL